MKRLFLTSAGIVVFVAGTYVYILMGSFFQSAQAGAAGGTITGRVVLVGDIPQAKKIKVTKDNDKCGTEVVSEELVVASDRGIQNAVVSVTGLKGTPAKAAQNPVIDQKGCVFRPHVLIAPVGVGIDILNNDGVLHNFHTKSSANSPINKAQPGFKKKMTETFSKAETFKVVCDAHPWMSAWIVVTDHPYIAATEAGGAFKITDVPPGNHTVEIWHETLGKVSRSVTVKAGEEVKLNIELSKK